MKTTLDTLQDAMVRLTRNAIARGFQQEALHEYKDLEGAVLYWRIRLKNPATKDKIILLLISLLIKSNYSMMRIQCLMAATI